MTSSTLPDHPGTRSSCRRAQELSAQGYGTAIVDAVFERDLEALGDAAAESTFSVGASGLGLGLARALSRGTQWHTV